MSQSLFRFNIVALAVACAGCRQSTDEKIAEHLKIRVEEVRALHARQSMTDEALMRAEPEEVRELRRESGPPDLPQRRAAFLQLQLRSGRGAAGIPNRSQLLNSARSLGKIRGETAVATPRRPMAMSAMKSLTAPAAHGPVPSQEGWVSLGPSNIGGRTRSILVDPVKPDRIWAASVGGGVWRSDDAGLTFIPVGDYMMDLAVCCLTMDSKHPDTIYAGTGEGFYNIDAIRGAGVFMLSPGTNGKWQQLGNSNIASMEFLTRMAMSPDGKVLLASGGSNGMPGVGGIFRSEDAGHQVWQQTHSEDTACVQFHPKDSSLGVAGGGWGTGEAWWTIDGGKTWNKATHSGNWVVDPTAAPDSDGGRKSRVELTYAAKNPNIVYALVDTAGGQIWKSTDGGKSYTAVATTKPHVALLGQQGWYGNTIWAGDPGNENFLLLGGINLWRSFDGGLNVIDISDWSDPQSIHADHHVIVAHPDFAQNKTVYFGNDGGIYKAADATTVGNDPSREHGWASLNETYGTTQFYGVAVSPVSGMIIAGAQDNGTLHLVKGAGACAWRVMSSGDGGHCVAHPGDRNFFYAEYVNLDLVRSRDGGYTSEDISGVSWQNNQIVCKAAPYGLPEACSQTTKSNFYAPFALDMRNPKRLLSGGASLWLSENADAQVTDSTGPSWRPVRGPMPWSDGTDNFISAISISPFNSNVVWIGYNDGHIFRTSHASAPQPDWSEVGMGVLPKERMVTEIIFDSANPKIVYATYGGISVDNIWSSTNGGDDGWAPLWRGDKDSLPPMPVFSLTMHPKNHQMLYIGTELGLLWSKDGGQHWSARGDGPTNCSVQEMTWYGQTLIAATHGRGIFQIDLTVP
jgi:hypothetical protein